jgi:DNA gyrase subunit A
MEVLQPNSEILAITERGYGKRTPVTEYRLQRRGGTGILAMKASRKVGFVIGMRAVTPDQEVMLTTDQGTIIRTKVSTISLIGRVTQGVRVMNLSDDEKLVAIDVVMESDEEDMELPLDEDISTRPARPALDVFEDLEDDVELAEEAEIIEDGEVPEDE